MGEAIGCCTKRDDTEATPRKSARTPTTSARKPQAIEKDTADKQGAEIWQEVGDISPQYHARLRRGSFSEGAGMEVNVHRLAMLTLKDDVSKRQLEHLQAVLRACVEYVPGLARWTFQPLLPDTEGLGGGHTHAMYLAFDDQSSMDQFDENPKHHEIEALIAPMLQNEESLLAVSWVRRIHLKESGVDRLAVFKVDDEGSLAEVLKEESECVKEVPGYQLCHHGPHHGGPHESYSVSKDFNYGFYASFEDLEALEMYERHPRHKVMLKKLENCFNGPIGPKTMVSVSYALT